MAEGEIKPNWMENTTGDELVVTGRSYEKVLQDLRLPDDYYDPDLKALSVGEGLSDFAKKLHEEKGVDIFAVDPIYEFGSDVLQKDANKVSTLIQEKYRGSMRVDNSQNPRGFSGFGIDREFPLPEVGKAVAASVYELPFDDESIDRIVSYRMLEHVDYSKALPEMMRVLKPDGEIRTYGCRFNIFPDRNAVLSTELRMANSFEGSWRPHPGLPSDFDLSKLKGLRSYILVDSNPGAKVGRVYPTMRIARMIVHRKDDVWPKFAPNLSDQPQPETVALIEPRSQHKDKETQQPAYDLKTNTEEETGSP